MDTELCGIKIKDCVSVHQLFSEGIITADGIDLIPGVHRHLRHPAEHIPSLQGQVSPADIQTGHQKIAAGGGLGQVDDLPHMALGYIRANQ